MNIGTTIRAHRLQKGLSQGDIEKKTGLLRCYLSRVENGHTVPSLDTLSKIALALDLPIAQFFADDSLGYQFNTAKTLRRGTALPHPDPPLLLQPERERPQAVAGHGKKVRRHGDPVGGSSSTHRCPDGRSAPRLGRRSAAPAPRARQAACSSAPRPWPGGSSARRRAGWRP